MRVIAWVVIALAGCVESSDPTIPPPPPPDDPDPPAPPVVESVWDAPEPADVAVDADAVYWISVWTDATPSGSVVRGSVERWNKLTHEHAVLAATTDGALPVDLAVSDAHVYWTELHGWTDNGRTLGSDELHRVAKTGGDPELVVDGQYFDYTTPRPNAVAAGGYVYWASGGTFSETTGAIARVRDADPIATVEMLATGLDQPAALTTNGVHMCFRTGDASLDSPLWCAPVAGGAIVAIAGGWFPYTTMFYRGELYWANATTPTGIERAAVAADAEPEAVQPAARPILVAGDTTSIYWSDELAPSGTSYEIRARRLDAPDTRLLVETDNAPRAIASDGDHLYFIEHFTDGVRRVPLR